MKLKLLIILAAMLVVVAGAQASQHVALKMGQSKNIKANSKIESVFITNPEVADYKVINDERIVVYAKKAGNADLTVYGKNSNIIYNASIIVDSVIGDIQQKINSQYPGSDVKIERFIHDKNITYVLYGMVANEEIRDQIYNTVGSLVGGDKTDKKLTFKGGSLAAEGGADGESVVMTERTWFNIINKIQIASSVNQVNVKLTVVEVTKRFTDAVGIEWRSLTLNSIINGGSAANSPGVFSLIGFKGGFDAANISTVINAIQDDKVARVLAQPNLTVLSGESANFLVGGEIPIVVDNKESVSVQYKEYGIRLNIGAKVESKDKIRLFVSNELSNITGSYAFNAYSIPTINTRRTSSTIQIADGDSFVIGGLLSEADKENMSKVPFIGDIPILGAIARSAQTEREKTELVVFATVSLVKPVAAGAAFDMGISDFKKTTINELFFNVNNTDEDHRLTDDTANFMGRGGFIK